MSNLNHYNTIPSSSPRHIESCVIQNINAPISSVWSIIRQFNKPQAYKHFIQDCCIIHGDGVSVGSIRELQMVSGLPATTSIERLDKLDEDLYTVGFSIVGGDHRLVNYRSTLRLLENVEEPGCTIAKKSYRVDVPEGISVEDTCCFVDTIIKTNLRSLARIIGR